MGDPLRTSAQAGFTQSFFSTFALLEERESLNATPAPRTSYRSAFEETGDDLERQGSALLIRLFWSFLRIAYKLRVSTLLVLPSLGAQDGKDAPIARASRPLKQYSD